MQECPQCGSGTIFTEGCERCVDPECPWAKC